MLTPDEMASAHVQHGLRLVHGFSDFIHTHTSEMLRAQAMGREQSYAERLRALFHIETCAANGNSLFYALALGLGVREKLMDLVDFSEPRYI